MSEAEPAALKVVADNRRARFDYQIDEKLEAGVALTGSEIKSVRGGHVDLSDGYARIDRGQVWLRNVRIAPWTAASSFEPPDPLRVRRLLLHKDEIGRLAGAASRQGYTIVPLRIYIKDGRAKVELGLARGKRKYDKRESIKKREQEREVQAALARGRRR